MNTDRTIILTMLANQQINADEAERLLILTEALHRVERRPHPTNTDEPLMSQLIGDFEDDATGEHSRLDFLFDLEPVDFESYTGIDGFADFFSLPDLPPFPEMINMEAFVNLPDKMPFNRDEIVHHFRDLHERLDRMKDQFADFQERFTAGQDDIGFDSEML